MGTSNNVLLVGPAGCGKTYLALEMAKNKKTLFLHMNANLSYENTVEGIQIEVGKQSFRFEEKPQVIVEFINGIKQNKDYCLILDDINRADLSAVLGELCFAFENRDTLITLKSGRKIKIPKNLTLIATSCSSDIHAVSNSYVNMFDETIYIDNSEDNYLKALRGLRDSRCTLSDTEFEDLIEQFRKVYVMYRTIYCVFNREYKKVQKDYEIGYAYFLPSKYIPIQFWGECIQHKIRHQVRPLLEQYVLDGLIKKDFMPAEHINDTKFVIKRIKEEHITVDSVQKYECQETDVFINEGAVPQEKRQGNIKANPRYLTISFLLKEIINHSLINQMDLFHMLTNDEEILTFRNDIPSPNGRMGGRLLIAENERAMFTINDKKNHTLSPYSDEFHSFWYQGTRYRLFSKYKSSDFCPYDINRCIETNRGSQNRQLYKTIKMLVYKYFKKYEENLETYLRDNDDADIESRLVQLKKDIEFVKKITTEGKYQTDSYYVPPNDFKTLVKKIKNLPTWKQMIDGQGVYRVMSTDYMKIMNVTDVRQMILQGPPGTSKTYSAKRFLCEQAKITSVNWEDDLKGYQLKSASNDENTYAIPADGKEIYWDIVQFHPSYTYEDFVRGIAVFSKKENKIKGTVDNKLIELVEEDVIGYKSVNRAIGKMAQLADSYYKKAIKNGSLDKCPKFFLLIDEINRANLATVFGELIFALEYRDKEINTPYAVNNNSQLVIPKNMYIIGTMNTSDKSIGNIDYAIRRRFLFFKLLPDVSVIKESIQKIDNVADLNLCDEVVLFYAVNKLFEECLNSIDYDREDVQLGHTYFLRTSKNNAEEQVKYKFIYQVLPILYEYKKDGIIDFERINSVEDIDVKRVLEKIKMLVLSRDCDRDQIYNELISDLKNLQSLQNSVKEFIKDKKN